MQERAPVLEVRHLKKCFKLSKKQKKLNKTDENIKIAVRDISFKAYEGEVYGLLGANGAGKTTTLRMLATLIKPDEGEIYYMGENILNNPVKLRKHIGFLTSELKLEDYFDIDYLFDFFSKLHGVDEEKIKERKEFFFNKFEINNYRGVKIKDLSTGMKQKASLIVSIAHDPDIVIFDEPTNGLDVLSSKTVIDFIKELKALGKTIILSTHIFSLIEGLADRVGIIKDGEIKLQDTLTDLTKEKSLEDIFFNLYEEASKQ